VEGVGLTPAFWRDRRVLITGHTGFKGSWLALWLDALEADIVGYSLDVPTKPALYLVASVERGLTHLEGDVRDASALAGAIVRHRPEIVIHMAAQSLVRRSYSVPVATVETNVMGTLNLLEAVRTSDVRVVINVTSDKCYLNTGARRHTEDDPKGGSDPYSVSKACAELITGAYRQSFLLDRGPAVASVRAGNVIGGGDWSPDRLVGDAMTAALDGRPLLVRNPDAIRPWQHVLNPLEGYLLLAERLWVDRSFASGWNFGPTEDDEKPVRDVVERIGQLWGLGFTWVLDEREHPAETPVLRLDSSRARQRLGWEPRWDLDHAITRVVEWYQAYAAGADMRTVALDQIRAFEGTPVTSVVAT
jgi:CDP-glucose 4,6-dehydratase